MTRGKGGGEAWRRRRRKRKNLAAPWELENKAQDAPSGSDYLVMYFPGFLQPRSLLPTLVASSGGYEKDFQLMAPPKAQTFISFHSK